MKNTGVEVIDVVVQKYRTTDGRIFDTPEAAQNHVLVLQGSRRICHQCKGTGKYDDPFMGWHNHIQTCGVCSGKGYVEKKEIWE